VRADADDADDGLQSFAFSAGKRHDIAARRVDDGLNLGREALQRVRFLVGVVIAVDRLDQEPSPPAGDVAMVHERGEALIYLARLDSAHTGQGMPEHPFGDVLGNTRFRQQ
jgi:hypothetical protein